MSETQKLQQNLESVDTKTSLVRKAMKYALLGGVVLLGAGLLSLGAEAAYRTITHHLFSSEITSVLHKVDLVAIPLGTAMIVPEVAAFFFKDRNTITN